MSNQEVKSEEKGRSRSRVNYARRLFRSTKGYQHCTPLNPKPGRTNMFTQSLQADGQSDEKLEEEPTEHLDDDQPSYYERQLLERLQASIDQAHWRKEFSLEDMFNFSERLRRLAIKAEDPDVLPPVLYSHRITSLPMEQRLKPIEESHEKSHWFLHNFTQNESSTWPV